MEAAIIGVLVFATVLVGTMALLRRAPEQEMVQTRLEAIRTQGTQGAPREAVLALPFTTRVLLPTVASLSQLASRFVPAGAVPLVRANLDKAGRRHDDAVMWIAMKWLRVGILGLAAVWVGTVRGLRPVEVILLGLAAAGLGYLWPELSLRRMIHRRQVRILKELPDTLDLLTIAVEAGLGLDQALDAVSARSSGPLGEEIRTYLGEVALGENRHAALRAIGTRTGVIDLQVFVSNLAQAMELGVSIAPVLRVQSDDARVALRQRIEERAQKAPIKLLFPLIFLILPALFVVVAGPGFLQIISQITSGGSFAPPTAPR